MIALVLLAGPTASGKSALAVEVARRLGAEIVNADSQQVYRGLARGTAQPSAEELAAVPHHLFGFAAPGEGMDAARWLARADAAVAEVHARGRLPLVVGGTGLYLRTLLRGVAEAPPRDPGLRAALEAEAQRLGRPALHARLVAVDPEAAARIRPNDLVRVVRALEMAAGGLTQSARFAAHAGAPPRYRARLFVLDPPREELHRRVAARAPALLEGLLDEARALLAAGPLPPRLPLGYAEAAEVLAGRLDPGAALARLVVAHRQYARRQVVWFRREPLAEWLRPPVDAGALADAIDAWRRADAPG